MDYPKFIVWYETRRKNPLVYNFKVNMNSSISMVRQPL